MYARTLRNSTHVRRFAIDHLTPSGWEVREELDSAVVWRAVYDDWHRVERATRVFSVEAARLLAAGWLDQSC